MPAGEQLDVLLLAGEHVDAAEPVGVAVLEVLQLLEEHDGLASGCRRPAVTWLAGSACERGGEQIERTGVMPLPAAIAA